MKKVLFVMVALMLPTMAFAADAMIPVLPDWIEGLLAFIGSIPAVGPILAEVVKYAGILAGALTAASALLLGVSAALAPLAAQFDKEGKIAKALNAANAFIAKILPWAQYLSMFNVQKKPAAPAVESKKK